MAKLSTAKRKKLPKASFAVPSKKAYPIHDRAHAANALARAKQNASPELLAKVRSAVAKRYPTLPSSKKRKADKVHAVEQRWGDIELGSYGSKWRHGWIPLNAPAQALKLKQLKASGGGHSENRAGHSIVVAPNHRGAFGALVTRGETSHYSEHPSKGHALRSARAHAYRQQETTKPRAEVRAAKVSKVNEIKGGFSKQEMMLPGVRVHNGDNVIVRPSAKLHNAGHKFGAPGARLMYSPLVEHDQFGVEHGNGAHLGHIDTNGGLHITGPGLPRHRVNNVKEAVAGLHANFTIRERERKAAEAKTAADAEAAKASSKTVRDEGFERSQLISKIMDGRNNYNERSKIEREALLKGSHEAAMTHLKSVYAEKRVKDIKSAQNERARQDAARKRMFEVPKAPKALTKDNERLQRARAELERRTGSGPGDLNGTPDEATLASIREGMPVTHGGRAGYVIARYGQTFDTYHPPTEGQNGHYMRHEIYTKRGRKQLRSTFAGHSAAKAS